MMNVFSLSFCICLVLTVYLGKTTDAATSEEVLLQSLFQDYNKAARPGNLPTDTVVVQHGINLIFLLDMNEKNKYLEMDVWLVHMWTDTRLQWDPSDYANYKDIKVPASGVWTPDIVLYNSATGGYETPIDDDMRVVVDSTGAAIAVSPFRLRSFCDAHLTDAHTGEHNCTLKFGSWVYNGDQLKLEHKDDAGTGFDMSEYRGSAGSKWDVVGSSVNVNTVTYACCPEPYMDITYKVTLHRHTAANGDGNDSDDGDDGDNDK